MKYTFSIGDVVRIANQEPTEGETLTVVGIRALGYRNLEKLEYVVRSNEDDILRLYSASRLELVTPVNSLIPMLTIELTTPITVLTGIKGNYHLTYLHPENKELIGVSLPENELSVKGQIDFVRGLMASLGENEMLFISTQSPTILRELSNCISASFLTPEEEKQLKYVPIPTPEQRIKDDNIAIYDLVDGNLQRIVVAYYGFILPEHISEPLYRQDYVTDMLNKVIERLPF
jgi:hypothetical protein